MPAPPPRPEYSLIQTDEVVRPMFERIFVKVDDAESTSPSGLVIPKDSKSMITTGVVVRVGTTVKDEQLREGQRVLFQTHAGIDIQVDGEKVRMMMLNDVFARFPLKTS